jgi:hypothetical protein
VHGREEGGERKKMSTGKKNILTKTNTKYKKCSKAFNFSSNNMAQYREK